MGKLHVWTDRNEELSSWFTKHGDKRHLSRIWWFVFTRMRGFPINSQTCTDKSLVCCALFTVRWFSLCYCLFFFLLMVDGIRSSTWRYKLFDSLWLTKSATGERLCIWICLSTSTCMRAIGRARANATRASSCSLLCTRQNPPQSSNGSESSSAVSRSDKEELCLL